jgi:hypothetical protein
VADKEVRRCQREQKGRSGGPHQCGLLNVAGQGLVLEKRAGDADRWRCCRGGILFGRSLG